MYSPGFSGDPFDDHTCDCRLGCEMALQQSTQQEDEQKKLSTHINDCPAFVNESCGGSIGGFRRGTCVDGLQSYSGICSEGCKVSILEGLFESQTRTPVICGSVRILVHASSGQSGTIGGFRRGTCVDWLQNCSGICSEGCKVSILEDLFVSQPRGPVICGSVRILFHASIGRSGGTNFDMFAYEYFFDEGFTLAEFGSVAFSF